ncbi:class A beta-lactamase-related serine hydrolase [Polaromonas sp. P2-4]|nr:class A beta-lactamase-related serine hydrolase [Polaromonas sp. P2-4]
MPLTCPSRRLTLKLAASSLAAPALFAGGAHARAAGAPASVNQAIARFAALAPATSHCLVQVDAPTTPWTAAYKPDQQLFVGSAVKTFILAQFLRDAEAGREGLSESQLCEVSDALRSPGSPVLLALSGKTPYRSVLEAMITHSDNTATDIALTRVGPERVRADRRSRPGADPDPELDAQAVLLPGRCRLRRGSGLGRDGSHGSRRHARTDAAHPGHQRPGVHAQFSHGDGELVSPVLKRQVLPAARHTQ